MIRTRKCPGAGRGPVAPILGPGLRRGTAAALLVAALALSACGGKRDLRPATGQSLPPKPYAAATPPTSAQLLTPTPQQRPQRSDELLKQSEERRDDRFDLPPP